jgi:hypothetical protein
MTRLLGTKSALSIGTGCGRVVPLRGAGHRACARKMACFLPTETMAHHQLSMESYDRLFPNQHTLPRGGFGNLIALPLQHGPRQEGNTVFVDDHLAPYQDQWVFLTSVSRIDPTTVDWIARDATRSGQVVGVRWSEATDDDDAAPWDRTGPRRNGVRPCVSLGRFRRWSGRCWPSGSSSRRPGWPTLT